MSRQAAMAVHYALLFLQGLNQFSPLWPASWAPTVVMVLGSLEAGLGYLQHSWNPDGTPATVAFIPK